MKTAVRPTSINAYRELNLNEQEAEVLTAIRVLGASCIADVAAYLGGWQRSTVSARMNKLKPPDEKHPDRKGLLVFVGERPSETTGITSEFWRARNSNTTLF